MVGVVGVDGLGFGGSVGSVLCAGRCVLGGWVVGLGVGWLGVGYRVVSWFQKTKKQLRILSFFFVCSFQFLVGYRF